MKKNFQFHMEKKLSPASINLAKWKIFFLGSKTKRKLEVCKHVSLTFLPTLISNSQNAQIH